MESIWFLRVGGRIARGRWGNWEVILFERGIDTEKRVSYVVIR
jgi:hypothetical protein